MAVFRVERTRDYTVMSNCHLRDRRLSLKAKGLLSQMLSLPEDWDYTLTGLAGINRESKDAIRSAVNELERAGYIRRRQTTDAKGKQPLLGNPSSENPMTENPVTEKPMTGNPLPENPTQLNTEEQNTERQSTDHTVPFFPGARDTLGRLPDRKGRKCASAEEVQAYRDLIRENIGYDILLTDYQCDRKLIDEIVELMVEVVSARREHIRVAGSDLPHELVKSRFLKLGPGHIQFVLSCLRENTTKVKNIKQYLLTVLFNAPATISNYYSSLVNHDMYGS